jgi:hypothetical protein
VRGGHAGAGGERLNLPRRKLRRGAAVPKEAIARGVRAKRKQSSGGSDARRVLRGRRDGRTLRSSASPAPPNGA